MIDLLADKIWQNETFRNEYAVAAEHALGALVLPNYESEISDETAIRLLQVANILASSNQTRHREAAYRINTSLYLVGKNRWPIVSDLLFINLSKLGNFPALNFALGTQDAPKTIPFTQLLDAFARKDENSVLIDGSAVTFNDFQKEIWNHLQDHRSISISAPTSAGKSFLLQSFLRSFARNNTTGYAAYIVPSRALINQVSVAIHAQLRSDGVDSWKIITVPLSNEGELPPASILVMTQERMQITLQNRPDLVLSLVIIDEAQMIGEENRGIILHSVISEVLLREPGTQLFFASPSASNPEVFSTLFPEANLIPAKTEEQAVLQNIIFIDPIFFDRYHLTLSTLVNDGRRVLGTYRSSQELGSGNDLMVQSAVIFGQGSQSLLYAMGPDECETTAFKVADLLKASDNSALSDLSTFIKEAVHPKYMLSETVRSGVGFHYGSMPTLLRKTIEDYFDSGDLTFLVSTSTLLHGVNLPARNMFLNRPFKGHNKPIEPPDFWNLIGRAGRLGREFTGNVFLVDYDNWPSKPLTGDKETEIRPTLSNHVFNETEALVTYINDINRPPEDRDETDKFEGTFARLLSDYRRDRLATTFETLGIKISSEKGQKIVSALALASSRVTLPSEVLDQSPTVSAYRQQRLYEYFMSAIAEGRPQELLPIHPLDPNAYLALLKVFKRLHTNVLSIKSKDNSHKFFAAVALSWMRGNPLPMIIDTAMEIQKQKRPNVTMATIIRETLTNIENALRFRYVRLTSCYNAVLRYAFIETKHANLVPSIAPLPMFLEVGASSKTMTSFMALGLSRISAARLSDLTTQKDMNEVQATTWLKKQDLELLNISPIIQREIAETID